MTMELIPAIDLAEGRVVRLLHGDFAAETRYDVTALDLYRRYHAAGARRLHVVDLDAARGRGSNAVIWRELAAVGDLEVQLGGGLRTTAALHAAFDAGVTRAVIGSVAVTDPGLVRDWLAHFGSARIVLALDVRLDKQHVPRLATHGWLTQSAVSLWDAIADFSSAGLSQVLCTDVACDGALAGPNLDLYREAIRRHPDIAWTASGGVSQAGDLAALAALPVSSAVCGRALLEGHLTLEELQPYLPAA
jgi:phosphoribosylformimino-5-aminoimidazole carboxamide ribotide isomerase